MAFPIHELAALGTATCWATTGIIASDAIRALGAFHFNLIRQVFVTLILAGIVLASGSAGAAGVGGGGGAGGVGCGGHPSGRHAELCRSGAAGADGGRGRSLR